MPVTASSTKCLSLVSSLSVTGPKYFWGPVSYVFPRSINMMYRWSLSSFSQYPSAIYQWYPPSVSLCGLATWFLCRYTTSPCDIPLNCFVNSCHAPCCFTWHHCVFGHSKYDQPPSDPHSPISVSVSLCMSALSLFPSLPLSRYFTQLSLCWSTRI